MNTRGNIILDLDQTLISSESLKSLDWEKYKDKEKHFTVPTIMEDYYKIFERPYLQEFLNFLFTNFNVCIWTAGTQSYFSFIVDNIIIKKHADRHLKTVLFSCHCDDSNAKKDGTKDLRMLWDGPCRFLFRL